MKAKNIFFLSTLFLVFGFMLCGGVEGNSQNVSGEVKPENSIELIKYQQEFSKVRIEPAKMNNTPGLAAIFEGTKDIHYYAAETEMGNNQLRVEAQADGIGFGTVIFPKPQSFFDKGLEKNVEVYSGDFSVFVPIIKAEKTSDTVVKLKIKGMACTGNVCFPPFEKVLEARINYSQAETWEEIIIKTASDVKIAVNAPEYSVWFAMVLALVAGLALNIMPCVWPVLPIIVMRIVEQARENKSRSVLMGLAFCFGILLFFACMAIANIVLHLGYGRVLYWGDQFRNPEVVIGMVVLLVVMALFMFGLFTFAVPSSIASKSGSGKGISGSIGMGFLAAILSTPCSFGVLATAFAWAQTQNLILGTIAIMVIGLGMAAPYAILTSMPGLLGKLPRSGRWMELFKQTIGFVLLVIAVKLISALPKARVADVLYFLIIISFCVWMWGGWVSYNTKPIRKWIVRIIAVALVLAGGWFFLQVDSNKLINWNEYDSGLIEKAKSEGRPILIKFTADWCTNCKVVDVAVYHHKDIGELIKNKNVLMIKADTTQEDYPATYALKNIYKQPAVPVSILILPTQQEPIVFTGLSFSAELKGYLEKI